MTFAPVLQGRADAMFVHEPAQRSLQQCLRTRTAPRAVRLKPGAHMRNVTSPVLAQTVRGFVTALAQRSALVAWLHAVTRTGGSGSAEFPLPAELIMHSQLNPTVAALVIALGQQLDLVDAAVHDVQVRMLPGLLATTMRAANRSCSLAL